MIFLECIGSRASLSAEEKQRTRELVHKELTLFYILKDWRFHKAFMRNPKRASLPNIMMNPILHSNFFLFTDMRIFCSITNSKKTGEFVFFRGFDEFFHVFWFIANGDTERTRQPLCGCRQEDIFHSRPS